MFEWWRRFGPAGVEYIQNEVTGPTTTARGQKIDSVTSVGNGFQPGSW